MTYRGNNQLKCDTTLPWGETELRYWMQMSEHPGVYRTWHTTSMPPNKLRRLQMFSEVTRYGHLISVFSLIFWWVKKEILIFWKKGKPRGFIRDNYLWVPITIRFLFPHLKKLARYIKLKGVYRFLFWVSIWLNLPLVLTLGIIYVLVEIWKWVIIWIIPTV